MSQARSAAKLQFVPATRLMLGGEGWDRYLTRHGLDAGTLAESVKQSGVVEPVTVEEWGCHFRIISGFRRAKAAQAAGAENVPATVYAQGALAPREAYLKALAANSAGVTLTDADRAVALAKARERFGFDEDEAVSIIAPLLGLPQSRKVVREYMAIAGLPERVLAALARGEKSREHAAAVLLVGESDREWFFAEVVEPLHLTASDTRLVATGAADLAAREGRGFRDVAAKLIPAGAAPGEARARLKEALAKRLTPVISEMEAEFQTLAEALGLPHGALVEHPLNFEADEMTLKARIADMETLSRLKAAIERGIAAGTFEKMLGLAGRKTVEAAEKLKRGQAT